MNAEISGEDELTLNLREIFSVLRRRIKLIAGTVFIGAGIVLIYLLLATPLYTATTSILLDPNKKNILDVEAVVSGLGSDRAAIQSEVELIRSLSLAKRVVAELRLDRDPEFGGKASASGSLFSTIGSWLGFSSAEEKDALADPENREKTLNRIISRFSNGMKVKRVRSTYVLAVSFTSRDPEKAARIANQIASSYLVDQLEAKYEVTKRATDWLNQRLGKLRENVRKSEKLVELYKARYNLQSTDGQTLDERQMAKLNEQLILARALTAEKRAKFEQVNKLLKAGKSTSSLAAVLQSGVISKLRAQQAEVGRRLAELTTRYGGRHPKVVNVRAERRDIANQIAAEVKRIIANLRNEYDVALSREASLRKSLEEIKKRNKGASQAAIKLRELEREATSNKTLYEAFLNRFKQTSEQETLKTADSRVIAKAIPPQIPSYPKKRLTLMLALVGFTALGVGLAFLLEHLDNSFKTGEQVEEVLKLAHLASIPLLGKSELKSDHGRMRIERYVLGKPLSSYAEAMRALKMGIQLSNIDAPPKAILVTSALPNEGKTTIASNLAFHAAQTGLDVLLIDADLRHPSLTAHLLQENVKPKGLVELLAQDATEEEAIIHDEKTGLKFLPSSRTVQNSAEILGSKRMREMIERAKSTHDLVILDTSPITPVIDARVLMDLVDSVVLVAEWDKTPRETVQAAIKNLKISHEKFAGVVLNKMNLKRMASYGRYGDSYYYKKYPYYYGSET